MAYSHSELVNRFRTGKTKGQSSSMVIDGDVLYSYGHHFPLLVRMPHWGENAMLMNADKHSITTSGHQSACFGAATVQLPFSALGEALWNEHSRWRGGYPSNDDLAELMLIDKGEARWDCTGRYVYTYGEPFERRQRPFGGREQTCYFRAPSRVISKAEHEALCDTEKAKCSPQEERRPEAVVLMYRGRWFLSSMDRWEYFLVELPCPCYTVESAFHTLMPSDVYGHEYTRQGEWFFVDLNLDPKAARAIYRLMQRGFVLPRDRADSHEHIATRGLTGLLRLSVPEFQGTIQVPDGAILVSGQVRHPEHTMARLSTAKDVRIFAAYRNTAIGAWSASGNVD